MKRETPEQRTLWTRVKDGASSIWNKVLKYPVMLLVAVGAILLAVLALVVGKRVDLGGILGQFVGKDPDRVTKANVVPSERVDEEGNPISHGEPDEHGYQQVEVEPLPQSMNPFRDRGSILVRDENGEKVKVKLPQGLKDKDVDKIIRTKPELFEIVVKKRPSQVVTEEDLDYLK